MDTFPHKDRGLENDPPPHQQQVEAAQDWCNMVPASRLTEPQHSGRTEAVSPWYQPFLPAERYDSPTINV